MAQTIKTSVIIPTYNGVHKVVQALDSLLQQTHLPDELILVIDGSTDHTHQIVVSRAYPFPNFKIIEQENLGRAAVRNRGAQEASNPLLIFLDDDIIAPPNWISEHIAHHLLHPNTLFTGRLEDPNQGKGYDFLEFKAWLNARWNKDLKKNSGIENEDYELQFAYMSANNFSIARDLFFDLEGFDGRLKDAEDYDLALRAKDKGYSIYFGYKAFAWHNDVTDCLRYIKRQRQYHKAQQVLLELKPDLYLNRHRYNVVVPKGFKAMMFKLLCKKSWIRAVDKGWFRLMPSSLRFKFYDLIVTANGVFFPDKVAID